MRSVDCCALLDKPFNSREGGGTCWLTRIQQHPHGSVRQRLRRVHELAHCHVVRAHALPIPDAIAATILDQQVCSHARHFVLNIFSTFSQLVMGLIGLRHPRIGYVRDLTPQQQRAAGVNVTFWRQLPSHLEAG